MKKPNRFMRLVLLLIVAFLQSCQTDPKPSRLPVSSTQTKSYNKLQKAVKEKLPGVFKSDLRPNEKLQLGKIYTDTVNFISFDDNGDDWLVIVKKNSDTVSLIYNRVFATVSRGTKLLIRWKTDSLRPAGDPEILDFSEFLISFKRINGGNADKNFSKILNQSFVISCGTGCAIVHNVKKISRSGASTIKVTFEIDTYTDQELTESYENTYIFHYNKFNTLEKVMSEGDTENMLDIMPESAIQSFKEFGDKLMD